MKQLSWLKSNANPKPKPPPKPQYVEPEKPVELPKPVYVAPRPVATNDMSKPLPPRSIATNDTTKPLPPRKVVPATLRPPEAKPEPKLDPNNPYSMGVELIVWEKDENGKRTGKASFVPITDEEYLKRR